MGLREDLLRGIYAYGFEKPSAIQQRAIKPIVKVSFQFGIKGKHISKLIVSLSALHAIETGSYFTLHRSLLPYLDV